MVCLTAVDPPQWLSCWLSFEQKDGALKERRPSILSQADLKQGRL